MVYVLETKLIETKSIFFALKKIHGINKPQSFFICKQLGFSSNLKVDNLSDNQIKKLITLIEMSDLIITSDLRKFKLLIIKRLVFIKSYRGLRFINGLPVRGQRTHTNSKTAKLKNRSSNI